jgi:hypothetical protein
MTVNMKATNFVPRLITVRLLRRAPVRGICYMIGWSVFKLDWKLMYYFISELDRYVGRHLCIYLSISLVSYLVRGPSP